MNAVTRSHLATLRNPWLEAPRRVWLASLGAAAVTRRWAGSEAAPMFRSLVRQGEALESLVLRDVGARVKASVEHARKLAGEVQKSAGSTLQRFARRPQAAVKARRASPAKKAPTRAATGRGRRASRRTKA